jgi:hypothetical protein
VTEGLPRTLEGSELRARAPGCVGWLGALIVGALVLVAVGAGLLIGRFTAPAPPSSSAELRATPAVITALRDLSRLETAEAHVERVIDLSDKQKVLFGLAEAQDAILLVAGGDVIAGVDLGKLRKEDVVADVQGRSVRIELPAAEILSQRLDSQRTYVHTRRTDLLARRNEALEGQARVEAERSIVEAAREAGLLERAQHNAGRTVEQLARSLGYDRVEIRFRSD